MLAGFVYYEASLVQRARAPGSKLLICSSPPFRDITRRGGNVFMGRNGQSTLVENSFGDAPIQSE